MFFIGIFGVGNRSKNLGEVVFKCTGCVENKFSFIELNKSFDIFFIPIFRYMKEYIIVCNNCKSIYKLKENSIMKILENREVDYEDVEKIILERNSCPYCQSNIEGFFLYCPKCGKSLKS